MKIFLVVLFILIPSFGSASSRIKCLIQQHQKLIDDNTIKFEISQREIFIRDLKNGKIADEDMPELLSKNYEEVNLLTGKVDTSPQVLPKGAKSAEGETLFPSQKVFNGEKHDEFDRTVNAIMFLKWVKDNNLKAIIGNQPAGKQLTQESLDKLKKLMGETLKTDEDWDAMIVYMSIHDITKSQKIADHIRTTLNLTTKDHDKILLHALEEMPEMFPNFSRLPEMQKQKIIRGMKADFNIGQFNQGENFAKNLDGLNGLDKESLDFYLMHVVADIAGVLGHLNPNGAMLMNKSVYKGFDYGIEALKGLGKGKNSVEVYDDMLKLHAKDLDLNIDYPIDKATTKISLLLGVGNAADAKAVKSSLRSLPKNIRLQIMDELNSNGVDDSAILVYYLPHFLKNLKAARGAESDGLLEGLGTLSSIYKKTRQIMGVTPVEKDVFTVHIKDLADFAKDNPQLLKSKEIRIVRVNEKEAVLELFDRPLYETYEANHNFTPKFLNDFKYAAKKAKPAREKFIDDMMLGKISDEEAMKKIPDYFPETIWLTDDVMKTADYNVIGKVEGEKFPSEKLFGQKYPEFDRTINKMMFLKWVKEGKRGWKKIIAAQKEGEKLSYHNFLKIQETVNNTLKTKEDWDAMFSYLAIRDLGRVKGIRKYIEVEVGINGLDSDNIFLYALKQKPELFPSFNKLSVEKKNVVIDALKADFNMGQLIQGENIPGSLAGMKKISKESRDFKTVSFLSSLAGAAGHVKQGAYVLDESTYSGFKYADDAISGLADGKTELQVYNDYLKSRALGLGFDIKKPIERAATRLALQMRLSNKADAQKIITVLKKLPIEKQEILIKELNKSGGLDEGGMLLFWAPQVLNNLKAHMPFEQAVEQGLNLFADVFKKGRGTLGDSDDFGVYTIDLSELAELAQNSPHKLKDVQFKIDKIGMEAKVSITNKVIKESALNKAEGKHLSEMKKNTAKVKQTMPNSKEILIQEQVNTTIKVYKGNAEIVTPANHAQIGVVVRDQNMKPFEVAEDWVGETFEGGKYKAIRLTEKVVLVRAWGKSAKMEGGFLSDVIPIEKISTKVNFGIKPEWGSSISEYSIVEIDAGTVIYIGNAESQIMQGSNALLQGGSIQYYIPGSYDLHKQGKMKEVYRGVIGSR